MTYKLVGEIAEFISKRSIVGTTYDLNPYVPQPVEMSCVMYVDPDYDAEELKTNVESYLESVIFSYGALKFDDTIVKSDLENEIKNTFEGILSFRINNPTEDIIAPISPENVLTKGEILIETKYL